MNDPKENRNIKFPFKNAFPNLSSGLKGPKDLPDEDDDDDDDYDSAENYKSRIRMSMGLTGIGEIWRTTPTHLSREIINMANI